MRDRDIKSRRAVIDNSRSGCSPAMLSNAVSKPMMSMAGEIVDEGLGEDFEDAPWVPPTVKRVSLRFGWPCAAEETNVSSFEWCEMNES